MDVVVIEEKIPIAPVKCPVERVETRSEKNKKL